MARRNRRNNTRRAAARSARRTSRASTRATPRATRTRRTTRARAAKKSKSSGTMVRQLPKGLLSMQDLAEMAGCTIPGIYTALKRHGYEKDPETGRWSFTKSEANRILKEMKSADRSRIGGRVAGPIGGGSMGGISHDKRKVAKAGGWGNFRSRALNRKPKSEKGELRRARRAVAAARTRARRAPAKRAAPRRTTRRRAPARRAAPRRTARRATRRVARRSKKR